MPVSGWPCPVCTPVGYCGKNVERTKENYATFRTENPEPEVRLYSRITLDKFPEFEWHSDFLGVSIKIFDPKKHIVKNCSCCAISLFDGSIWWHAHLNVAEYDRILIEAGEASRKFTDACVITPPENQKRWESVYSITFSRWVPRGYGTSESIRMPLVRR